MNLVAVVRVSDCSGNPFYGFFKAQRRETHKKIAAESAAEGNAQIKKKLTIQSPNK